SRLTDGAGGRVPEGAGVPIDRVAAPVKAERCLLVSELLGLGPRRRVGEWRGAAASADGRLLDIGEPAEQMRLPFVAVTLQAGAVLARGVPPPARARAHGRGR